MRFAMMLLAACLLAGCADNESQSPLEEENSGVEREIQGFTLTESHDGIPEWQLNSEYAWRIPNDKLVRLKNIAIEFYGVDGEVESHLTALGGEVDEESGEMTARDRVRLVSSEGDTLTTDELVYSKEKDRVTGPGFVRLAKPDRVLTGFGFDAKPDLSDYEVRENVTITIVDRRGKETPGN